MELDDIFAAGRDIMDQVADAIRTGDYQNLAGRVQGSIDRAAGESAHRKQKERNFFLVKRPDPGKGKGRMLVGILFGILPGLMTLMFVLGVPALLLTGSVGLVGTDVIFALVFGLITYGFAMLARSGKKQNDLVKRYYEYGALVGNGREYVAVSELAERTGRTREEVCADITAMRAEGYLPYAVLDRAKSTVILTDEMYRQYAMAEAERARREEEERVRNLAADAKMQGTGKTWEEAAKDVAGADARERVQQARAKAGEKESRGKAGSETDTLMEEGNAYIVEIRAINDRIPDTEEMSDKLYRLENIMKRIFAQVEKHPENAKDLRRLMEYYLPTTIKLLRAYAELNEQPEAGENIRDTKRQIESSMDAINGAFEKLLDDMFQKQAWDLSSDLNVMKTMMAQDGLT